MSKQLVAVLILCSALWASTVRAQGGVAEASPPVYTTYAARPILSENVVTAHSPLVTTYSPVVRACSPVVTYSPVWTTYSPVVTSYSYSPVVSSYAYAPYPYFSYSPSWYYSYAPYYSSYAPYGYTYSYSPVVYYDRPSFFVPGQPLRNVLRAIAP